MATKAKRSGKTVSLPMYRNAEMLMLEFFKGERITIQPKPRTHADYTDVHIDTDGGRLNELVDFINNNI